MGKLITSFGALLWISCIWVVPMIVIESWDLVFRPVQKDGALLNLFLLTTWLIGGFAVLNRLLKFRRAKLLAKVLSVAPPGYKPLVEIFGLNETRYLGISPDTGSVVIVDTSKNIAFSQPLDFLQGWELGEGPLGGHITFSFNSFDFSHLKILVPPGRHPALAAKLRHALA